MFFFEFLVGAWWVLNGLKYMFLWFFGTCLNWFLMGVDEWKNVGWYVEMIFELFFDRFLNGI